MASETTITRLNREYKSIKDSPTPLIIPIFQWTIFWNFKNSTELSIKTTINFTPNGIFRPNTRLCLSISDFHPETWNPGWTISAILSGLQSS